MSNRRTDPNQRMDDGARRDERRRCARRHAPAHHERGKRGGRCGRADDAPSVAGLSTARPHRALARRRVGNVEAVTVVEVVHFTDPACPWAYSASPAHAVLRWRFGDQLDWRLTLIGLAERADDYAARGYDPVRSAMGRLAFRRFGMPLAPQVRDRLMGTARGCRAVVAARLHHPGRELAVLRALQFAWFTTPAL